MTIAATLWVLGVMILITLIAAIVLSRIMFDAEGNPKPKSRVYAHHWALFLVLKGDHNAEHRAVGLGFAPRIIGYESARYDAVHTKVAYFMGLRFVYLDS